jgi:hypothetical protein
MKYFRLKIFYNIRMTGIAGIALLFLACTGAATKFPLNLPEDATSYLTNCSRMVLKSSSNYWKNTGIKVVDGDMILLLGSGTGSTAYTFRYNFMVKIENNPETTPFTSNHQTYGYGYFKAPRTGMLKLKVLKLNPGHTLTVDIITFPEKNESKLFEILRAMRDQNPADDNLQGQIDGFLSDYSWINYSDLEIVSSPNGASVYLDDKYKGLTPLEITEVDKHTEHKICVQHEHFLEFCENFNPQAKSRFNVSLKRSENLVQPPPLGDVTKQAIKTDQKPPHIMVISPALSDDGAQTEVSDYEIEIRGKAQDESGIVWVRINNEDINLDPDGTFWSLRSLAVGMNVMDITARDIHNNIARQQVVIQRRPIRVSTKPGPSLHSRPIMAKSLGSYYLLAVGNNEYKHLPRLKTAENDAQAVANICEELYGFKVELIINGTRRKILQALDRYRRTLTTQDNLLIYYAGHGYFDRDVNRGYWLPVDAMENTSADWISNADITDKLKVIPAKHIMVVADSCYSGTLTRGLKITERDHGYLSRMAMKKSRTVLTSGGLEPVLDGAGGDHSVFARVFMDILIENDQLMDATELFEKLRRPVMLHSPQTPQYSDLRLAGHDGGDFLFYRTNP